MYAYFGFAKLLSIASAHDFKVIHKPMDLHDVMAAAGSSAFEERSKQQLRYLFGVEARRWAAFRGVEWLGRLPTHHHKPYDRVNRLLVSVQLQNVDMGDLALRLLRSHWRDDADLTDDSVFTEALDSLGIDPTAAIEGIASEEVAEIYSANTEEAKALAVMGSPTYFLDDEMFYGQDRLEMIEWRLNQAG